MHYKHFSTILWWRKTIVKSLLCYYIIAPFFNCWAVVKYQLPIKIKDISMTTYCHWQWVWLLIQIQNSTRAGSWVKKGIFSFLWEFTNLYFSFDYSNFFRVWSTFLSENKNENFGVRGNQYARMCDLVHLQKYYI